MTSLSARRGAPHTKRAALAIALLTATLVPGLAQLPALADDPVPAPAAEGAEPSRQRTPDVSTTFRGIGDTVPGLRAIDTRGRALPSVLQRRAVARLGDVQVRWNRFGT